MPSQKNVNALLALTERLGRSTLIVGTGYTGLDGVTLTGLRRSLREKGLEYRVVKNTLAAIAAEQVGRPGLRELLQGPTALVLTSGDVVEAAKALQEFLRSSRLPLVVRGGVVDGRVLRPADLTALAELPPRPVLAGQVAGQLQGVFAALVSRLNAPLQRLASVLNSPVQGLATVLQRHGEQTG